MVPTDLFPLVVDPTAITWRKVMALQWLDYTFASSLDGNGQLGWRRAGLCASIGLRTFGGKFAVNAVQQKTYINCML